MNQFVKMFSVILEWENDKPDVVLMQKGKGMHDSFVIELIKAMQSKPWLRMEKQPKGKKAANQSSQPTQADREPTEQEIAAVTALGFDSYMASHALRMCHFNTEQAIETMLTNQDGLLKFIEKEQLKKFKIEQAEMEKALQMSMSGESTSSPQDQDTKPLTTEEFDLKAKVYLKKLISLLVQVSDTTLINRL